MEDNFKLLKKRTIDALDCTDLEYIRKELFQIKEPTIFSGVGGSHVVSEFGSKILNIKNEIISINREPRDILYQNNKPYKNIISCSYSGNNYGVEISFLNSLKKYLLSNNSFYNQKITYLQYKTTLEKEKSFISLAATLIPISVLIDYYLDGKIERVTPYIEESVFDLDSSKDVFEIFSGKETSTASTYLESTLIESGIGIPIVHDKYSFCHGRSTLGYDRNTTIIYFNRDTELDRILLKELAKENKRIIRIQSKEKDPIIDDYQMLIQCMYLTKQLAEKHHKDLSKVDYSPIVKTLYPFKGGL